MAKTWLQRMRESFEREWKDLNKVDLPGGGSVPLDEASALFWFRSGAKWARKQREIKS